MHKAVYQHYGEARACCFEGRIYRSRYEAKWAYVLSSLGIPFYYEPSTYRLPSGLYLPDFWLPTMSAYLEIKPVDVHDPRYDQLGEQKGVRVLLADGDMPMVSGVVTEQEVYPRLMGHIWLKYPDQEPNYMLAREAQGRYNFVPIALASTAQGNHPDILQTYLAASLYDFERP